MSKQRECYAFRGSMGLGQIDKALEEMASSGWRLPDAEELGEVLRDEEVRLHNVPQSFMGHIVNTPLRWYWSSTLASESPYAEIRECVNLDDKETRVVVKYNGKEQDSACLFQYGTILVRDCE